MNLVELANILLYHVPSAERVQMHYVFTAKT